MRVLKPFMSEYVEKGIMALRTPHMIVSINETFARRYARLQNARNPARVQVALQRCEGDINEIIISSANGEEMSEEELVADEEQEVAVMNEF
jgi:hypothetical protein